MTPYLSGRTQRVLDEHTCRRRVLRICADRGGGCGQAGGLGVGATELLEGAETAERLNEQQLLELIGG